MKKRFTERQIIDLLRQAEAGMPIKELESENVCLKKLLAETLLEKEMAKEALRRAW